jgi:hypothetical protein
VAFGDDWDSYFIVFASGGWVYDDVPAGLSAKIESQGRLTDLKTVSLGSGGSGILQSATQSLVGWHRRYDKQQNWKA